MAAFGSTSMWGALRRVLVRRPLAEDASAWRAYGWRAAPDVAAAQAEHEAFCSLLEEAGAEVVVSEHDPGNPDAIYTYDATLVGRDGAVLLLPGKEGRRREPEATVAALELAGSPSPEGSSCPRRSREATRSGWTTRRCSSGSGTGRIRPRARAFAQRSPASR